jgi:Tfp pilus assembly PilM family ATPase
MIGPRTTGDWVGLVCDASSATLFAACGNAAHARLVAQREVDYESAQLHESGRLPPLEQFVAEHQLKGGDVYVAFVGPGTIVQRLTLPPLNKRNQLQAVQTHLMNYADGRELAIDVARDPRSSRRERVRLVAAGVDRALSRTICAACHRAGLRVRVMTALAAAFGPTTDDGALVQLILGERTTTIQLFHDGRLGACRDILLGRRDFVQAYQRPILSDRGPITLSAPEADTLAREVGVPVEREDEVRPGVLPAQLWPMLDPVLQRLQHEIEQSLSHSEWQDPRQAGLSLLGLTPLPGLDKFLAAELQLRGPLVSPECPEASYLAAFSRPGRAGVPLDLRPPEERFAARMIKPALAASLCALLIMLGNSAVPRKARASLAELHPVTEQLQGQLANARAQRAALQADAEQLAAHLQCTGKLLEALPARIPVIGPLKTVFGSVPREVELLEVQLSNRTDGAMLHIRGAYRGRTAASLRAARWARELSESAFFVDAKVTGVSGSGQDEPAVIEIRAELKGG